MSAPKQPPARGVWDATPSVRDRPITRNSTCPWPCLRSGKVVSLQTVDGFIAATWCKQCDQAVTRAQWLALLEDGAA